MMMVVRMALSNPVRQSTPGQLFCKYEVSIVYRISLNSIPGPILDKCVLRGGLRYKVNTANMGLGQPACCPSILVPEQMATPVGRHLLPPPTPGVHARLLRGQR